MNFQTSVVRASKRSSNSRIFLFPYFFLFLNFPLPPFFDYLNNNCLGSRSLFFINYVYFYFKRLLFSTRIEGKKK
uniref:Uncharacterized protein n=1 Tax=Meloidogyne enterolobii TaxID=390850 RepID=A0A6V7V428_MELEN|nr:unnamed protein product [Meloidogyne enterolobii]